jgi:NAD-dependent deacetylase
MKCGKAYSVDFVADKSRPVPLCSDCGGIVKPDVVLYEESLDEQVIMQTVKAISECDMLIVAGTSLAVYPAAGFLRYFNGAYSVLINLTKTENERSSDIIFHEKVGDVLSEIDTSLCIK